MKVKTGFPGRAALALFFVCATAAHGASVHLQYDQASPQASYAARKLAASLSDLGHTSSSAAAASNYRFVLSIDSKRLGAEAFSVAASGTRVSIEGGDSRGLIYGALALREQLLNGVPIDAIAPMREKPALPFRGIKFNTPWDTYRPSSALDQHYATARDLKFWEAWLDMMAENRFNAFTLWTMHPFTYMVRPTNFPEASKWSDAEFAEWQHLYREIFRMAKERGLDTYVVFWSIFVSEEFSKAHHVASKNFYPHYYVDGDTSDITKRYLRESVAQMLEEYPDLDGIGVSHGEGMGGMTPLQRQQFVDDVYVAGALNAKRKQPVKLIHRVPFSSGLTSGPGVSTDVEKITRTAMEKLGRKFSGPIWAEMKFNWSHGHSTPRLVKVHGGKLGDTYFKPPPSNYKIVWQVRNEDFFALRWGVPDFIREHIALNGAQDYVGGYFIGSETYIPALDYFTKLKPVDWQWAFQRQWLFYKLWGRLLYDPKTPDAIFQAEFTRRYGKRGENLLRAFALASNTQMRLASFYDSRWDFTLYGEGMLALQGEHTRYIGVDALIAQPTMDPAYVSIPDFVKTTNSGGTYGPDRITPLQLADLLERDCMAAMRLLHGIETQDDASLLYEVEDVQAWTQLGLHLANKLRGAVALATYRAYGDEEVKRRAISYLQSAQANWSLLSARTRPIYRDMKLTHYNGNSFDANPDNLFHWDRLRAEVARDVDIAVAARGPDTAK
jgi:hypothetical protein